MTNSKPCFIAGVCCIFYTLAFAQAEWPKREAVKDTSSQQPYEELSNEIPAIYYQSKPSVLVLIDGEPVITVDEDLRMYRILNTQQLIIKNHHDNRFYLYWDKYWYVSDSATYGYGYLKTYPPVIKLIDSLIKQKERLALRSKGTTRSVVRPTLVRPVGAKPLPRPQIIVTTQPAELIQTRGEPVFGKIAGTSLEYVTNTSDDIFRDTITQTYYILVSGRWYAGASLTGSWTYKKPFHLPEGFNKIPGGSEKARVMSHVAGTDSARRAVENAGMVQKTRISRTAAITPNVVYDGGAEFSSVSNTGLFVSENSNIPVVNIKDKYYALQDGVWFVSNEAIASPWQVSTERPTDIDKIPPTHRLYHARFVYVYDTTAEYVTTGYTAGYLNSYVQDSVVIWGTGWPYKSWYRRSYFIRTPTWGSGMKYSPFRGWIKGTTDMVVYRPKDITNF